ncbi:MAG TPA: zinc-binding dehydrogenase [Nitrososphaera sp.]|jgi:NADPH:quinone reductase-like Zn-dependent oxidoreductase
MKAVAFSEHGSADVLHYQDFPDPVAGKNEVVIDVEYCGVNHLDIWTRMGIAGKKIRLPHICGCDIVGTVSNKGERVMVYPGYSCGRCKYCKSGYETLCSEFAIIGGMSDWNGGYAEKVVVPSRNIIKLPSALKSETAATLAVSYLVAWNMLKTNGTGKGKTILVYGATSGVGMATIQLARGLGARVITTVSGEEKRKFAERLGADHVIDRASQNILEEVKRIAAPAGGVDIVVDHVGAATWPTSVAALRQGGRMAVCGMTSGNDASIPVRMFYSKQIVMTGALMGTKAHLHELIKFVVRKKIRPVIDSVIELKDAKEAQKKMENNVHMGKILLQCRW